MTVYGTMCSMVNRSAWPSIAQACVVFTIAFAAVVTGGCGGPAYEYDAQVSGTVTVDGELAKSGTVTFHPLDQGRTAIGRIHSDGSYSLRTGQGDLREIDGGTVIPGEYVVTVSINAPHKQEKLEDGGPPLPGPRLISEKYLSKETSDLQRTVEPGKNVFVLNLERAEPADSANGNLVADESTTDMSPKNAESQVGGESDASSEAPAESQSP